MAIKIDILKHQAAFLQSEARHTGLCGGFGSGKSITATLKTIEKIKRYPGISAAYYLPTYPLIKDIAFPNFEKYLQIQKIPYKLNRSDKEFNTPLGKIIMRSMDNPSLIVGYEVGYSVIDEADILSTDKMEKEAVVNIVARNRTKLPDNSENQLDLVSTPEGFKFMYKFFVKKSSRNRNLIKAKTKDNPYLPDGYIQTLEDIYTAEQLQAYLNGEFVNLTTGTVYRNFDRKENHSDRVIKPHDILHVGMDFNITNMNAVVHVIDKVPIAVAEITRSYDTSETCNLLKEHFGGHRIVVYPDASGANRNTSGKSDIDIIKSFGFTVRAPRSNPLVRDRVNAMNMGFLDNKGNRNYLVNTDNCPVYTEALELQTYNNGTPDKQGGYDHINEAAGYFIWGNQKKKTMYVHAR